MDLTIVVLRGLLSLGVVLGLVWFASKRLSGQRLTTQRSTAAPRRPGVARARGRSNPITVVGRQSLGGRVSLALVDVGEERFLLGVSEHGVTVVTTTAVPEPEPEVELLREEIDLSLASAGFLEPDSALGSELTSAPASTSDPVLDPQAARDVALTSAAAASAAATASAGAMAGSILSPATWRETLDLLRARTVRR